LKLPFFGYSLPIPRVTGKFIKELNESNLDIVHIHSPFTVGKSGIRYAKKNKIPVIGTMHSQIEYAISLFINSKKVSNKITRKIVETYNECDECWAVNGEIAKLFCSDYGYRKIPEVVLNATDMLPITNVKESNKLVNKKYSIRPNERVFLFVGRINVMKNILFIIDSLKILKDKKFKFKMLFVGVGKDEELLKDYIRENDLENDVILCGKITDRELLTSLYARADLFLFPSLSDANSLVQIEAASQKTPTVFIEGSATSSTATNNVNGFITKNDVNDYADTIMKVMKDKKLYKEVSNNAFRDLYKNWDDLVLEVYDRYLEIIKEK
jgi:glycosyltransferase involved in cell wall biosynthesis